VRVLATEQGTHEWFKAKLGKVGGSSAWKAMDFVENGSKARGDKRIASSAAREKYKLELALEIVTGMPAEHFVSAAMDKGTEYEPKARSEYLFLNDVEEWETTGFVLHPKMERFGASPDLLVGTNGGCEFKCPLPTTHATYLREWWNAKKAGLTGNDLALAVIPEEYVYQCESGMACCEREWWDWASYAIPAPDEGYPEFPENLRFLQIRLQRDEERINRLEQGIAQFNEELLELVEDMRQMHNGALPGSKIQAQLKASL
jgi:hypothetical protein